MAGPPKKRAQAEKQNAGSSESQQSSRDAGYDATKRSSPASIPRLDGNRDPGVPDRGAAINYSKLTDLKNISEFMGIAGWCVARGVSTPTTLLPSSHRTVLSLLLYHAAGRQANGCRPPPRLHPLHVGAQLLIKAPHILSFLLLHPSLSNFFCPTTCLYSTFYHHNASLLPPRLVSLPSLGCRY
jgi:hypothetical protein